MKQVRALLIVAVVFFVVRDGLTGVLTGFTLVLCVELLLLLLRLRRTVPADVARPAAETTPLWPRTWPRFEKRHRDAEDSGPGPETGDAFPGLNRLSHFSSLREFDLTMRSRLEAAAAVRLVDRHGVDLRAEPERARGLLGDEAWRLLDPARPTWPDRYGVEVNRRQLDRLVRAIEDL